MKVNLDIYAIVEATQELHFGNVRELNVGRIELATVPTLNGEIEKLYMSPTKVRGVARRSLLWKLKDLGDEQVEACGIPATCGTCAVCRLFGALSTTAGGSEGSIASRIYQAGGVAIQLMPPEIKQRLSSPTYIIDGQIGVYDKEKVKEILKERKIPEKDLDRLSTPMPYEMEYVVPSTLFPMYWHSLLLEVEKGQSKMSEPEMVAFCFLDTLKRLGAGHPKGVSLFHYKWRNNTQEPLLVVDVYKKPLGKRCIISPMETNVKAAIETFTDKAKDYVEKTGEFERYLGKDAEKLLRNLAAGETPDSVLLGKT